MRENTVRTYLRTRKIGLGGELHLSKPMTVIKFLYLTDISKISPEMLKLSIFRRALRLLQPRFPSSTVLRKYHSYPDPNELPVITTYKSSQSNRQVEKRSSDFDGMKKFSMINAYGDVPSKGANHHLVPITEMTKLPNGLLVASQEKNGLMSSFSLIVAAGSSFECQKDGLFETGVTQMLENCAFRSTFKKSQDEVRF